MDKSLDNQHIRYLYTNIIFAVFFCFLSIKNYSQEIQNEPITDNKIVVEFVKPEISFDIYQPYFNVLKITNNSSQTVNGQLIFSAPAEWQIDTIANSQITILSGETHYVPVRATIPRDALGGQTYMIAASLYLNNEIVSGNSYITLPINSNWTINSNKSSIYLSEHNNSSDFTVKIQNKGNSNENIKLHIRKGKLLYINNISDNETDIFITLNAYKDTSLTFNLQFDNSLSDSEISIYQNNWKETAVYISASTDREEKNFYVQAIKLNSSFENKNIFSESPLHIDVQANNLMQGSQPISLNYKIFGTVLFKKKQDFRYLFSLNNMYFDKESYNNIELNKQFRYSMGYNNRKTHILVGSNVQSGSMHSISGHGAVVNHKINKNHDVGLGVANNQFSGIQGANIRYYGKINRFNFKLGGTVEQNINNFNAAQSLMFGTGVKLFNNHSIGGDILLSNLDVKTTDSLGNDTSVVGYSYRLKYSFNNKKAYFRISNFNSLGNYIRSSGRQKYDLFGKYNHNNSLYSILNWTYNSYTPQRIVAKSQTFYNKDIYNIGRFSLMIPHNSINYQAGIFYNNTIKENNWTASNIQTIYTTHTPGLTFSANLKLKDSKSVTPSLSVGSLFLDYSTTDSTQNSYKIDNQFFYSAGISFYDIYWKVRASYNSSSTSELYRSTQVDAKPTMSQSINIMPSYERLFYDNKVGVNLYLNYSYYMPSGRENVSYNIRSDFYMNKGWFAYLSFNVFTNTRVDEEVGRITTKNINMFVGIRKSFNIQQPRMKYYNLNAIFYNDINGNFVMDSDEPPISNILVNIEPNIDNETKQQNFAQTKLLSDNSGGIEYIGIPAGEYVMECMPIDNLESLFFINGNNQKINIDSNEDLFIPLSESYKIQGRIIVNRDKLSSDSKISLENVRVSAIAENGETISSLTGKDGFYILYVPRATSYTVKLNNIFDDNYYTNNEEYKIIFGNNKTINVDFIFNEKKRGVNTQGESLFEFNLNNE